MRDIGSPARDPSSELIAVQLEYRGDCLRIVASDGSSVDIDHAQWRDVVADGNRLIRRRATGLGPADRSTGWSPASDDRLRELWAGGVVMDRMIEELDRNSGSIQRRLFVLDIIRSKRELSGR